MNSLSGTWQCLRTVDLAGAAAVSWQRENPCGQSVGSKAKPVRNNVPGNGSPIPFHPGGKAAVFQFDTHGWTEVRGGQSVALCGPYECECARVCVCLCVSVGKRLTSFGYCCHYLAPALRDGVVRGGHSWSRGNSNDPQCSSLNQEVPIKTGWDHWRQQILPVTVT